MNTIKKHINILLLGCCSLNFISCTDLTEEIFSDITEDSYKYEAGDATKVVGAAYTNLQDWGYCGSGQAPMLSQEIPMPQCSPLMVPVGMMGVYFVECINIHGTPNNYK